MTVSPNPQLYQLGITKFSSPLNEKKSSLTLDAIAPSSTNPPTVHKTFSFRSQAQKFTKKLFPWRQVAKNSTKSSFHDNWDNVKLPHCPKTRLIFVNDARRTMEYAAYMEKTHHGAPYRTNSVHSSKYTVLNFLPKSLFEQFRRVANFYFLIISLLQLCTNLSPTNQYSTIGPLLVVLCVTMIKEGVEDYARHQQDWLVNHKKVHILNGKSDAGGRKIHDISHARDFQSIAWENVHVGHVIKLHDQEQVPADMILLFSSHKHGEAMCETVSLDCESNLKLRHCMPWNRFVPYGPKELGDMFHCEVRCEAPNKRLYSFDGVLRIARTKVAGLRDRPSSINEGCSTQDEEALTTEELPITIENVLLRGMKLCNTEWVIGVVVGGGKDTKLMQNMKAIPSKFSRLDRMANRCIVVIFLVLFTVCCFSSIQALVVRTTPSSFTTRHVQEQPAVFLETWVTYLILYNNMVPISLYISLEIVKWYQARRMEKDGQMFCPALGRGVTARTSNVNEDLGQIKYIFSDKTGTLTKNQMLFKACSIGGIVFDGSKMHLRRAIQVKSDDFSAKTYDPKARGGSMRGGKEGHFDSRPLNPYGGSSAENDVRPYTQLLQFVENPLRLSIKEKHALELARPFFRSLLLCHSASVAIEERLNPTTDGQSLREGSSFPAENGPTTSKRPTGRINSFMSYASGEVADAFPVLKSDRSFFGSSPDEVALLNAAVEFDCIYEKREGDIIAIRLFGHQELYRVLALNEFDSTRKCMSVVVKRLDRGKGGGNNWKEPDALEGSKAFETSVEGQTSEPTLVEDEILVFSKGADTVMFTNATKDQDTSKLALHVHYFAVMALRTLLFGYRTLSTSEYLSWKVEFDAAKKALTNRDHLCANVAKQVEKACLLVGATGVEDLLQEGVKECISQLSLGGINLWMLTGDKDETAISIAHMCGLIHPKSKMIIIKGKSKQDCLDEIAKARQKLKREGVWIPGVASQDISLVINGEALEHLLADTLHSPTEACVLPSMPPQPENGSLQPDQTTPPPCHRSSSVNAPFRAAQGPLRSSILDVHTVVCHLAHELFLDLASQCRTVVACRLSPMQKAQVVSLMKAAPDTPLTLAVGDGGNDVSMIQEAHVGVGIYGHEGMQAVRAADFAIVTFRHLSRLLLVHGRWNHRRVARVILFSFYKNMALILTLFLYSFCNDFSGQTLYESYLMVGWNVLYTLFPLFVLGITDEDIRDTAVLRFPLVYQQSLKQSELSLHRLLLWVASAILHSLFIFYIVLKTMKGISSQEGLATGLFADGTVVYGALILTVTFKASLHMQRLHRWTRGHYVSITAGFLLYLIFVATYSQAYQLLPTVAIFRDFYGVSHMLFSQLVYWVLLAFTSMTCLCFDLAALYLQKMYLPSSSDIILEIDSGFGTLAPLLWHSIDDIPAAKLVYNFSTRSDASGFSGAGSDKRELKPQLLEWRQQFRDFDQPTEHDELSKQLVAIQRDLIQEVGPPDPFLQEDTVHSSRALHVHPSVHPLTLEFMGEQHQRLEIEYDVTFAYRERSRVLLCLKIMAFLIPLYATYEVYWERDSSSVWIRVGYFVCDVLYMRFACTKLFVQHYQLAMLVPYCLIGMALTLTISDTGKFAAALYPISLFVVIRVKFLYALILSVYNFAFYLFADRLHVMNYHNSVEIADLLLFVLYLAFVISFGAYACYSLQITMRRDFLQSRSLLLEQKRSTHILHNMLPEHVVRRLEKGETLVNEEEQDVTILFCDIADFASFVTRFSPTEVVSLLDRVYSLFDQICHKHGVRKMETVGKTYMACAGLQGNAREGRQAAFRAVSMALDMLSCLATCRASSGNGIKLRIGIHSGRVVSGLVGMKKQQFSLFGDTVNTASRMQSTGLTGHCQVSHVTYEKLVGHFTFHERQIDVKGKGQMTTYLVGQPQTEVAQRFCTGDYNVSIKRTSVFLPSSVLHHVRGPFQDKFLIPTSNKIRRLTRQWWVKYNPTQLVLGSPPEADASERIVHHMLEEIRLFDMCFKESEMENKYLESTHSDRVEGARTTLISLALYALFTCIRDFIVELCSVMSDYAPEEGISPTMYVILLFIRSPFALFALFLARRVRRDFVALSESTLRNLLLGLYLVGLFVFTLTQALLWKLNYIAKIDTSTRYVNLCLDTVLTMFVVSNGRSILYRHVILFNLLALFIVSLTTIVSLLKYHQDASKFNTKFKTSYPIVLTYFSVVAHMIASQSVEFFMRRQLWLKTRTQLETMNADRLLYQMLPAAVVMRLKEGEMVCDTHRQVGILFSDIKGFTSIASHAATAQVVNILASLFCAFDKLTEKHGVFKMQTIGDAYVIVSGLPYVDMSLGPAIMSNSTNPVNIASPDKSVTSSRGLASKLARLSSHRIVPKSDTASASSHGSTKLRPHLVRANTHKSTHLRSHIRDLLAMARDMHKEVCKVQDPNTGEQLEMRIGLHIGNIIGGVIGTTTLRYDMWGPDALTANELETNGVPGKILVSPVVQEVVKDMIDIRCTFHRQINFTNIPMMDTYLVDFIEPDGSGGRMDKGVETGS